MDFDERKSHMHTVVQPRMSAQFQRFDPVRFADFACETCHGDTAIDRRYAMPNPDLPLVDASGIYRKHRKKTPEMAAFMWEEVEPTMAELIGLPRHVVRHKRGFHCGNCHPRVK